MIKLEEQIRHLWYVISEIRKSKRPIQSTSDKNRIFLFGIPKYMNYGDLGIAQAEKEFLHRYFPEKELISVSESRTDVQLKYLKRVISKTDIIAISGGGNMNDLYPFQDEMRIKIFKMFPNNRIISFPQSVAYNLSDTHSSFYNMIDSLKENTETFIFTRDKISFNFVEKNFPTNVNVFLTPDIALNLKNNEIVKRKNIITTFLRKDSEKLENKEISQLVSKLDQDYIIKNSDTVEAMWMHVITNKNLKKLVDNKLAEFSSSKLIITDRLHGMIFSIVTGTSAIVFDNSNHKIKYAYEDWFTDIPYIYYADNYSDLYKLSKNIMEDNNIKTKIPNLTKKYDSLIKAFTI